MGMLSTVTLKRKFSQEHWFCDSPGGAAVEITVAAVLVQFDGRVVDSGRHGLNATDEENCKAVTSSSSALISVVELLLLKEI